MIGGVNTSASILAGVYNIGESQLNDTLIKIATGKKFQNASEDILGFFKSSNLNVDISGYQNVKQELTEAKTYTSAALQAGSDIYENLTEMKGLASQYEVENAKIDKDQDTLDELTADFDALQAEVQSIIDNSKVDGKTITETAEITSVALDPDATNSLSVTFTADLSGMSALTIAGGEAGVTAEMTDALSYLTEAKTFDNIVDQQIKMTDTIIASKQAVDQLVSGIDEAEEMIKAIDQQVRQQATISMLAQANQSRQSVMQLYM